MPFYQQRGVIPHKRHTAFKKPDGTLYREELMGTKGFSGIQSILYHHHAPTEIHHIGIIRDVTPQYEEASLLRYRHFKTFSLNMEGNANDPIMGRSYVFGNEDIKIAISSPNQEMNYFYRNAQGDEVFFVHEGKGQVESIFGTLPYQKGDYMVIPVGTTYRMVMNSRVTRFLVIESNAAITTPRRYRNEFGQLMEDSPFCERDIHPPRELVTYDEKGDFEVRVKLRDQLNSYHYHFHPFDVVGWDGYLYPWTFNIGDFEPITGRVHMPPPVHQTFAGNGFVVCSFVPRLYDYHPEAIPAPYFHSNVDSDEVLYYVGGNFMSRKGINEGSITLHPMGLPHGPHPGKIEESIGKKETNELAVMIDTFKPLRVMKQAHTCEDETYVYSWSQK